MFERQGEILQTSTIMTGVGGTRTVVAFRSSGHEPEAARVWFAWGMSSIMPAVTPPVPSEAGRRHPLDPDPVPATKAGAVLALGVAAALTGVFVGGLVPATLALLLAREVRDDLRASGGYLIGRRRVRTGVALAWTGIVLAAGTLVVAVILGLLTLAAGGRDFAPTVN
jgi:hydroxylaminobenzene mutase